MTRINTDVTENARRNERIAGAQENSNAVIEEIRRHDLYPLAAFLGIDPDLLNRVNFIDLFATPNDFTGSDMRMVADNILDLYIQDKIRGSTKGSGKDLLLEICRMYRLGNLIIIDGGRDLHCLFTNVEYARDDETGLYMVQRDWEETKTKCDLLLLHPKGDTDYCWIKAGPAKEIGYNLFERWKERFHLIEDEVLNNVFKQKFTVTYNGHMWSEDMDDKDIMDIKCMPDKDTKKVVMPNGEIKTFSIAKVLVFITESVLGDNWVRTRIRN